MAMAVASAATRTEVRRSEPPRLRVASRASTPNVAAQGARADRGGGVDDEGCEQGGGDDEEQRGHVPQQGLAGDGRDLGGQDAEDGKRNGDQSVALAFDAHLELAAATRHGFDGRHHTGFARGGERRGDGDADADDEGEDDRACRDGHHAGLTGDIEGVHGGREHAHGTRGQHAAQGQGGERTERAEERGFEKECGHHGGAACSQSAHDADVGAAADDRDRDRVVDEKGADQQGDVAENSQVPTEGCEHLAVGCGLGPLRAEQDADGERSLQRALPVVQILGTVGLGRNPDEDAVDAAKLPGRLLRGTDVHQDGVRSYLRGVLHEAAHGINVRLVVDEELDLFANGFAKAAGHPDRVGIVEVLESFAHGLILDRPAGGLGLADHVDSDQRDRLAGGDDGDVIFDAGADVQCVGQGGEPRDERLGDSAGRCDLEVVLAGERLHGGMEGAGGGVTCKIDGDDGGIAQCDGEEDQQRAPGLANEGAKDQPVQQCHATHSDSLFHVLAVDYPTVYHPAVAHANDGIGQRGGFGAVGCHEHGDPLLGADALQ